MKIYPSVTILFPTHNGWEETESCLNSIKNLNYPKENLAIIVIDNASTDGTVDYIKNQISKSKNTNKTNLGVRKISQRGVSELKTPRTVARSVSGGTPPRWRKKEANSQKTTVRLVESKTNLGFARAVNLGVKQANSELLLITNNDVLFDKNCLKELVKTLLGAPKIGGVGGKVTWKNQARLSIDGFRLNPYLAYHQFDLSGLNQKRECDWISGNCLLTRRKLFLKLGGFDERFFFYFEDIDFSLRAKKAGFKLFYTPKAVAYHDYGMTIFKESLEKIFYLGYCSRWRCLFKNATLAQILISSVFLLLFSPLYQSLKTRHNAFRPMLKGLRDNLKQN